MFFLLDCLNVFQTVSNSLRKVDNEVDNEIDNGKENPPAVTLEGTPKRDGGRSPFPTNRSNSLELALVHSKLHVVDWSEHILKSCGCN